MHERKTEILAVSSGKGGTGKTMVALCMGYALQRAGHRVLFVDADLGTDGLTRFILAEFGHKALAQELTDKETFSAILDQEIPLPDEIGLPHNFSKQGVTFSALVSTRDTEGDKVMEIPETNQEHYHKQVSTFFERLRLKAEYDYVLVDTRGGFTFQSTDLCALADSFVIVSEPGQGALAQTVNLYSRINERAKVLGLEGDKRPLIRGIIVNKAIAGQDQQELGFRTALVKELGLGKDVEQSATEYTYAVPVDTGVIESYQRLEIPYVSAPHLQFCQATMRAFSRIFNVGAADWPQDAVDRWRQLEAQLAKASESAKGKKRKELLVRTCVATAFVVGFLWWMFSLGVTRGKSGRDFEVATYKEEAKQKSSLASQTLIALTNVVHAQESNLTLHARLNVLSNAVLGGRRLAPLDSPLWKILSTKAVEDIVPPEIVTDDFAEERVRSLKDPRTFSIKDRKRALMDLMLARRAEGLNWGTNLLLLANAAVPKADQETALKWLFPELEHSNLLQSSPTPESRLGGTDALYELRATSASLLDQYATEKGASAARAALIYGTKDADTEIQGYAVSSLGEFKKDPAALAAVAEYITNQKHTLDNRGAAATTLHRIGLKEAVPILTNAINLVLQEAIPTNSVLLRHRSEFFGTAFTSLGNLKDERAVPILLEYLDNPVVPKESISVLISALQEYPNLERDPRAAKAILGLLQDEDDKARGSAVTLAAQFASTNVLARVLDIAGDKNEPPDIRGAAATTTHKLVRKLKRTIPRTLSTRAEHTLISMIQAGNDEEYRGTAITSLGLCRATNGVQPLLNIVTNTLERAEIRKAAATALLIIGDTSVAPALEAVAAKPGEREDVAGSVIAALGFIGRYESIPTLLALATNSSTPRLRGAADSSIFTLFILGKAAGNKDVALEAMTQAIPNLARRELSLGLVGAGSTRDKRLYDPLIQLLRDEQTSEQVKSRAALALARIGGLNETDLKFLRELYVKTRPNTTIAEAVATALATGIQEEELNEYSNNLKDFGLRSQLELVRVLKRNGKPIADTFFDDAKATAERSLAEIREDETLE